MQTDTTAQTPNEQSDPETTDGVEANTAEHALTHVDSESTHDDELIVPELNSVAIEHIDPSVSDVETSFVKSNAEEELTTESAAISTSLSSEAVLVDDDELIVPELDSVAIEHIEPSVSDTETYVEKSNAEEVLSTESAAISTSLSSEAVLVDVEQPDTVGTEPLSIEVEPSISTSSQTELETVAVEAAVNIDAPISQTTSPESVTESLQEQLDTISAPVASHNEIETDSVGLSVVVDAAATGSQAQSPQIIDQIADMASEGGPPTPGEAPAVVDASDRPSPPPDALIAEVNAAPHKVYLLNKVRKSLATATDPEHQARLTQLEAEIVAEIESRKVAKEALCERAEALKDSNSWKVTGDAFKSLFDEWKTVGAAGRQLDDELWARFNAARGAFNERRSKHFEEREGVWGANREKKEALCAETEALIESSDWKATAEAIRDLQARWKEIGSAGRDRDEALWARFNGAKQKFFDRRGEVWEENRKRKEGMVLDAEALKDSEDWRTAGDAMKAMQNEWKLVGPAGREHEDELWNRFRAATQTFFDRRSNVFAERNKIERENMSKKQELCERAEALVYTSDGLAAAREAKDLQAQWKDAGPVPRDQSDVLWRRFREACDKIFANAAGERDRQQNEWHTRMREAMLRKREQMNALRESITHDEANIERWRDTLSNLKPGGKSEELGKSLEDKIIDVMERMRGKQERVDDLRASITDIEAKLRE